jgi:hypothetical protein
MRIWLLTVLLLLLFPATAWAAVVIDLDYITEHPHNLGDYGVDTVRNVITVNAYEQGAVVIKGDGTNHGLGWSITIYDAFYIYIEDGTTIYGSKGNGGLNIISKDDVYLVGGGAAVYISSIDGHAIYSESEWLTLDGQFGVIVGADKPEATFGGFGIIAHNLVIAGQVGLIAGGAGWERKGDAVFNTNGGTTLVTGTANMRGGNPPAHIFLAGGGMLRFTAGTPIILEGK